MKAFIPYHIVAGDIQRKDELAESETVENRAVFMKDALSQIINIIKKVENYES